MTNVFLLFVSAWEIAVVTEGRGGTFYPNTKCYCSHVLGIFLQLSITFCWHVCGVAVFVHVVMVHILLVNFPIHRHALENASNLEYFLLLFSEWLRFLINFHDDIGATFRQVFWEIAICPVSTFDCNHLNDCGIWNSLFLGHYWIQVYLTQVWYTIFINVPSHLLKMHALFFLAVYLVDCC